MPVGPVTGETVFELLMSSDAANPQAHETTCCSSDLPTYDCLKPFIIDVFMLKPSDLQLSNICTKCVSVSEEFRPI